MKTVNKKTTIGIIGYGNFGKLLVELFSGYFENIFVYSKELSREKRKKSVNFVDLEKAAGCEVVILAVPIPAFKECLFEIKDYLKSGTILVDVCSVKKYPAQLMKRYVKNKKISLLATHPMWGKESVTVNGGLKGLKVVLCPIRLSQKKLAEIKRLLKKIGLKVIMKTPEEHDKEAACSQALAQFVGKSLKALPLKKVNVSTLGFGCLESLMLFVTNDTDELFYSLQNYNPYSKSIRKRFLKVGEKIEKEILKNKNNKNNF